MVAFRADVLVGVALCLLVMETLSLPSIAISPKRVTIMKGDTVSILCNDALKQSLIGCQFMQMNSSLIDLSAGTKSKPPANHSYVGAGLNSGECGMKVSGLVQETLYTYGCRVRAETGGWVYDIMTILLDNKDNKPLNVVSGWNVGGKIVLAHPGQPMTVTYYLIQPTRHTLSVCAFQLNGVWVHFDQGGDSPKTSEVQYHGDGLKAGACGVKFFNITEKHNGQMSVKMRVKTPITGHHFSAFHMIVVKPPHSVTLTVNTTDLKDGETLSATCTATKSRPITNMTWYLGDDMIRSDAGDDSPVYKKWRWGYDLQTISQNISRPVTIKDHGKVLICATQHQGIPNQGGVYYRAAVISVTKPDAGVIDYAKIKAINPKKSVQAATKSKKSVQTTTKPPTKTKA